MASSYQGPSYDLIDKASDIRPALAKLREGVTSSPFLAVDCEGESLSRKGQLSLVSVALPTHTYLFDIKTLGAKVFDEGLRDLLQDPDREKLMFDCRSDSDCLWHQYHVKLTNVLDLQLLQIIYRETNPEPVQDDKPRQVSWPGSRRQPMATASRPPINVQPVLRSFLRCLELYVDDKDLTTAKAAGKEKMEREGTAVWMKRPLEASLLAYAAADVQGFLPLYRALRGAIANPDKKERLRKGSQNFLDYLRSRSFRTYDDYERNGFLPWRILPASGHERPYTPEVYCKGCKRAFPRQDFFALHIRRGIQHCPVCRKIYGLQQH
ncbi:piRNA biogenesis protein EXD1-like [Acanthaster planci]|uniref:PiRNA biogenesis protein EXD1-like n=1 Tax=Acanthaster planci TaxID=133434 RepID=A0A8B7YFU1_ACAPL|nr:piRNA biogenesis protein EXD1-like [Acanthaster planci]